MTRLFSDEALRGLARSPHEQVADAIAEGDADAIRDLATTLERSFVGTVEGTRNWVTHTIAFVARERPAEDLAGLIAASQEMFSVHPDPVGRGTEHTGRVAPFVAMLAARGEADAALARFDAMEDWWRRLQDLYRDWLSVLLSHIYRTFGIDELDACLRDSAERTLFSWMPVDMARPPERRLPSWARMFHGHFSGLRIEEDDEKFTLVQDPCGTCSRQIAQGRYGPPLNLAVITESHPATWFRGETPIYRAHVPVWHIELARERVGVPWPVNQCPAGMGTGPCRVLLYKDPLDPRAQEQVPT